jgi:hypothetical protein
MKKRRGGQIGNQNAARGRKEYLNIFGQRWPIEIGNKILSYLQRAGLTQKQYLEAHVQRDILSEQDNRNSV